MARNSNWSLSVDRPVAVQSPSLISRTDIRTKLTFSSGKSPSSMPKKLSLLNLTLTSPGSAGLMPQGYNNKANRRLVDYHMSKQNPDVLDKMYSPTNNTHSLHKQSYTLHKKTATPIGPNHRLNPLGNSLGILGNTNSGVVPIGRSPTHEKSLLRQILHSNRHTPSVGSTSLVELATRGVSVRAPSVVAGSPVIVKLSGGSSSPLVTTGEQVSAARSRGGVREGLREKFNIVRPTPRNPDGALMSTKALTGVADSNRPSNSDPCDKNVVLSALRKRRKRWATSAPEDHTSPTSPSHSTNPPMAKRSRHSTLTNTSVKPSGHIQSNLTSDRKRSRTTPSYATPAFKRSKPTTDLPEPSRTKISVPEIEYESGSEASVEVKSTTSSLPDDLEPAVVAKNNTDTESVASSNGSDVTSRGSATPPIQIDETEMNKKREESLNVLKAVFPSTKDADQKSSLRRKLPIFCGTGAKPHLPTPLSVTHSVTQEDLQKDREETAAKLKEFLATDDEEPVPPTSSQSTSAAPLSSTDTSSTVSVPSSNTSNGGFKLTTAASTASSTGTTDGPGVSLVPSTGLTLNPSSIASSSTGKTATTAVNSVTPISLTGLTSQVQQQAKSVSFGPLPGNVSTTTTTTTSQAPLSSQTLTVPGGTAPNGTFTAQNASQNPAVNQGGARLFGGITSSQTTAVNQAPAAQLGIKIGGLAAGSTSLSTATSGPPLQPASQLGQAQTNLLTNLQFSSGTSTSQAAGGLFNQTTLTSQGPSLLSGIAPSTTRSGSTTQLNLGGMFNQGQQQATLAALGQQKPTVTALGQQQATLSALGQQKPTFSALGQQQATLSALGQQKPTVTALGQQITLTAPQMSTTSLQPTQPLGNIFSQTKTTVAPTGLTSITNGSSLFQQQVKPQSSTSSLAGTTSTLSGQGFSFNVNSGASGLGTNQLQSQGNRAPGLFALSNQASGMQQASSQPIFGTQPTSNSSLRGSDTQTKAVSFNLSGSNQPAAFNFTGAATGQGSLGTAGILAAGQQTGMTGMFSGGQSASNNNGTQSKPPSLSGGFNFNAQQTTQNKANPVLGGGLTQSIFGSNAAFNSSSTGSNSLSTFSFSANTMQQQSLNGGTNTGTESLFGGSLQQQQPKTNTASQFNFSAGLGKQQNQSQGTQSAFNFSAAASGMGIGQNQGNNLTTFNAGMSSGNQTPIRSNVFGNQLNQQPQAAIFKSPTPNTSFTAPSNPQLQTTPSNGFNFTPNSSLVGTPSFNFSSGGVQNDSGRRVIAKSRRSRFRK